MRIKEDNLLKVADDFEKSLIDQGYDSCFDDKDLADTFKEIMDDYKTVVKSCDKEGIDIGNDEINEFKENFICAELLSEKEVLIEEIKEKIISLMNLCDNIPEKISEKYACDLFDLIDDAAGSCFK